MLGLFDLFLQFGIANKDFFAAGPQDAVVEANEDLSLFDAMSLGNGFALVGRQNAHDVAAQGRR